MAGCNLVPDEQRVAPDSALHSQASSTTTDAVQPPPSTAPVSPESAVSAPFRLLVPEFTDATSAAGLGELALSYANMLDLDHDQRPDLLVNGHRLFRNESTPGSVRFDEITAAAGLEKARSGPALAVDIDNDGWVDIVSTGGQLWRNCGDGSFRDVGDEMGFAPHPKAVTLGAGDVNGDGYADLYVGMQEDWNDGKPVYYAHELWLNQKGTRLEEVSATAGIDRKTYGRSVLFADVDDDGDQDIFVANYRLQANMLWINNGQGRFVDKAQHYGVRGRRNVDVFLDPVTKRRHGQHYGHTIGACWLDVDGDGAMDLFTANLVHKYVGPSDSMGYDIRGYVCDDSAIYRRIGPSFLDWRQRLGIASMPIGGPGVFRGDELWAGCVAGDLNNDGWTDVFVPQIYNLPYATSRLFLNIKGGSFQHHAEQAGIRRIDTYAGVLADIDGDGWLDVITGGRSAKDAPPALCLYRNLSGERADPRRHWLRLRVITGASGGTALGTIITARFGSQRATRLVGAGTSTYGQQNDPLIHVGLGEWSDDVQLTVRWPWGKTHHLTVSPDCIVELRAPHALGATAPDPAGARPRLAQYGMQP